MEELSLKWDEHHPAVISVFEELLAKGTLVDCTIAADGQYVKAHKVVLAACSPYFELLFSQEAEKNPIVVLKDMKFQELKHLIDFVYRGQVKLPKDQLDAFVSAAETLQIKGLSGQQKKKISERFANKTVSSREGCSSPVPRKRRRSSYTETNEDSQSEPGNESSSDSNMRENFIPTSIPLGVPSTSTASSSTGISSHSTSSQQSRSLTETRFPSHDQPSASPEQVLPDVQTVVKTEPEEPTEPLAQVFFPEPKNEEYVDDLAMLESGAGSSDMQGGTSQENTNNYPGYDSSGDTFLMNQMADQNTASGAVMERSSPYGVQPRSDPLAAVGSKTVLPPRTKNVLLKRRSSDEHLERPGLGDALKIKVQEKCRLSSDNSDDTAHDAAGKLIRTYLPKSYCKQKPVAITSLLHPDSVHTSTSSTSNKLCIEEKPSTIHQSSRQDPHLLNKTCSSSTYKFCSKQKPTMFSLEDPHLLNKTCSSSTSKFSSKQKPSTMFSLEEPHLLNKAHSSTSKMICSKQKLSTVASLQDPDPLNSMSASSSSTPKNVCNEEITVSFLADPNLLNKSASSTANEPPSPAPCEEELYACALCANITKRPVSKKRSGMIMTECSRCGCVCLQNRKRSAEIAKKSCDRS